MQITVTDETFQSYVGGELEAQNQMEGYIYRGEIGSAELNEEGVLSFTLVWMAKGEGYPPLPTGWVKSDLLAYKVDLSVYRFANIGSSPDGGDDRICLDSKITNETVILYPPNGSKLDQSKILKS